VSDVTGREKERNAILYEATTWFRERGDENGNWMVYRDTGTPSTLDAAYSRKQKLHIKF
jgi:hypothetical protein